MPNITRACAYVPLPPQVKGADAGDDKGGRQVGCRDHVSEAVGEGGVEDHLEPVGRVEQAVLTDAKSLRGLHPAVGRQNPKRRNQGPDGDDDGRGKMHPGTHAIPAEEHDPEKGCLQEESREHFVSQQRTQDVSAFVGKRGPVGAELKGEHHPRDHPHPEGNREYLGPHAVNFRIDGVAGFQPAPLKHRQPAGQPDREGRENNVEGYGESELNS